MKRFIVKVARKVGTRALLALPLMDRARTLQSVVENMRSAVPIGSCTLHFYSPSPGLVDRARSLLTKEPDTIAWIDSFARGSVFWDVGANVGAYSLYAAATRKVHVLSFEPAAANFYCLVRNIRLNGLEDQIDAFCVALGSTTIAGTLNLSSEEMGSAASQFGRKGDRSPFAAPDSSLTNETVLGFSLDDFVSIFAPPFPTHLKVDVDGLEPGILAGAVHTLTDDRLQSVLVELNVSDDSHLNVSLGLLNRAGFRLVSKGQLQGSGANKGANHLFRRA